MELKIIGSGSSGNGYLLTASTGARLLIELGCEWPKIQEALDYNYDGVEAIVSHCHSDHAKSVSKALTAGLHVGLGADLYKLHGEHYNSYELNPNPAPNLYYSGEYTILSFPLTHDVPCLGFLVLHEECGIICFITDTAHVKYTPPGKSSRQEDYYFDRVSHWLIEANYCEDILLNRVYAGSDQTVARRTVGAHLSVQACETVLRMQDLSQTETITLIHLSDGNSNAAEFKNRIIRATGKPVNIAEAGLTLTL